MYACYMYLVPHLVWRPGILLVGITSLQRPRRVSNADRLRHGREEEFQSVGWVEMGGGWIAGHMGLTSMALKMAPQHLPHG